MAFNFNNLFKKKKQEPILETCRYTFTNKLLPIEQSVYNTKIHQIEKFWKAFKIQEETICERFENKNDFDLAKFIISNITPISKHIMWEFGPALNSNGHRLVLSAESRKDLRPLVELLVQKAPLLENWEFHSYRPAEDFENAILTVQARTNGNLDDLFFQIYINEFNQIDLFFIRETCKSDNDFNQAKNDVFVALETLIGEEKLDKWIGVIEVNLIKQKDNDEVFPIEKLQEFIFNEITKMELSLPTNSYFDRWQDSKWGNYELNEVVKKDNYSRKEDLLFTIAMDFKVMNTQLAGIPFYGERFSRKETFCYLKIDGLNIDTESPEKIRADLEDKLNEILILNALGCTIGGGVGYRHSYIDFALADLEEGVHAIRAAMITSGITKNAWILFQDLDKQTEWIGIYEDTPVPFMS